MNPRSSAIEIGQRYRQVGGGGGIWIVSGITTDHAGNPHAQLRFEGDRTRVITIAFAALRDRAHYERIPPAGRDTAGTGDAAGSSKC